MPVQKFIVNGKPVEVDVEDETRLLWVLRDLLGVTGPKYGCGLQICQACTSHLNGDTFNPCITPVGNIKATDEITTIEGLADTVEGDLHPVQQIWLDQDVAQCGFCQPGQIMAAVGLIKRAQAENREITDGEFDSLENICRCGTYPRVRSAIRAAQNIVPTPVAAAPNPIGTTAPAPATPAPAPAPAPVPTTAAAPAAAAPSLPATGGASMVGPAAAAIGAAMALRRAGGGSGEATSEGLDADVEDALDD